MRNLVLSGGGVRGLLHLGALKSLEEKQLLKNIENYGGSSAKYKVYDSIIIMYWIHL